MIKLFRSLFFLLGETGIQLVLDPFICPRFNHVSVCRNVWVTMGQSRLLNLFFEPITITKFVWAITITKSFWAITITKSFSPASAEVEIVHVSFFVYRSGLAKVDPFSDLKAQSWLLLFVRSDSLRNPYISIRSQ